jgi:glycosyltransferase involved in cell wall biosynthesis
MSRYSLRVVQVISGLEIADGGPSYSVPRLNEALHRAGLDGAVFTDLAPGDAANDDFGRVHSFVREYSRVPLLRKLHFSRGLSRGLSDRSERIDLIHSHGLWRMPNIYAARAARHRRIPIVVSPRGMLSKPALQLSSCSKRLFWHLAQKSALDGTACFHATSAAECEDIRKFGIRTPIAVIPNGVDLPGDDALRRSAWPRSRGAQRTLLFLGRIHPIKGVDRLVAAWSKVEAEFAHWRLRIVGPGEPEHLQSVRDAIGRLAAQRVSVEGAVYGEEKWRTISEANLFILPSHTENFGIAVAESLACGRPVITTKGTPWREVETHRCGWWIDGGQASIEAALRIALSAPVEILDEMGARGAAWVKHAFTWDHVGEKMAQVCLWLCLGAPKPDSVMLN